MSGFGILASACPLPADRFAGVLSHRLGEALASWRVAHGPWLDAEACVALFGVGPETLERIASGEVDPEPDLEARIRRIIFIEPASAFPGAAAAGTPTAGDTGKPSLAASSGAPLLITDAWLKREGEGFAIQVRLAPGQLAELPLEAARQIARLVEIHDNPETFTHDGRS